MHAIHRNSPFLLFLRDRPNLYFCSKTTVNITICGDGLIFRQNDSRKKSVSRSYIVCINIRKRWYSASVFHARFRDCYRIIRFSLSSIDGIRKLFQIAFLTGFSCLRYQRVFHTINKETEEFCFVRNNHLLCVELPCPNFVERSLMNL